VYGDLSLRKSGDLDILVHKYDLLKAKYLLIERGYRPVIAAADEKAWLQNHYHLHFRHENGLFLVELHWAFTYEHWGVPLDLGAMQHNLESIVLAERTIAVLPDLESLLILCIHGTKHAWSRLVWICDIAEMLRRKHAMDWTTLLAQADALRLRRILYLGLFLAGELLQAPIPQDVWRRIQKDLVVRELAAQVRNRLFVPRTAAATEFDPQKFRLQTREHWRDRFRYFRHDHLRAYRNVSSVVTPNSQDRRLFPLPNSFRFVHYGLRPLRLATLYGVRFSSLLLKYLVGR
jgi:hypothetical protein